MPGEPAATELDAGVSRPLPPREPECSGETVITPTERLGGTNCVRLRVVGAGERGTPVVVLAHGFPELAYSWYRNFDRNRELTASTPAATITVPTCSSPAARTRC